METFFWHSGAEYNTEHPEMQTDVIWPSNSSCRKILTASQLNNIHDS